MKRQIWEADFRTLAEAPNPQANYGWSVFSITAGTSRRASPTFLEKPRGRRLL